jgi:hypothetical protein
LVDGNYFPVATNTLPDGTVYLASQVLGLELRLEAGKLRFYNPARGQILLTHEEEVAARQTAEEKTQRLAAKLRELNIDPDSL